MEVVLIKKPFGEVTLTGTQAAIVQNCLGAHCLKFPADSVSAPQELVLLLFSILVQFNSFSYHPSIFPHSLI